MIPIIIAFPRRETACAVKKILLQSGYRVEILCVTGAQVLQSIDGLSGGIVICGFRFADMIYEELYDCLPDGFSMLLVASPSHCKEREIENLVCLTTPLKANELLATLQMMECTFARKKKRVQKKEHTKEEKTLILRAKSLLMDRNNLSEDEAHRYLQKRSMENGVNLVETAQMILSLFS